MSNSEGLGYLEVWVDDTASHILFSGESAAETGIRLRLWLAAAKGQLGPVGMLPDDDRILARMALVSEEEWAAAKPKVTASWTKTAGGWRIRRIIEQKEHQEQASKRGQHAANSRWGKRKRKNAGALRTQCTRTANAMPEGMPGGMPEGMHTGCPPSPSPSSGEEKKKSSLETRASRQERDPHSTVDNSDPPRDRWLTEDQEKQLSTRLQGVQAKYPRHWMQLGRMIQIAFHRRPPFESFMLSLQRLLENGAKNPVAYASKILRVESQNHHEFEAIARHEKLKAGTRGGAFEAIGDVLARAQAHGEGQGR